jgi:hypothetical protein
VNGTGAASAFAAILFGYAGLLLSTVFVVRMLRRVSMPLSLNYVPFYPPKAPCF